MMVDDAAGGGAGTRTPMPMMGKAVGSPTSVADAFAAVAALAHSHGLCEALAHCIGSAQAA